MGIGVRVVMLLSFIGATEAAAQSPPVEVPLEVHDGRLWVPVESETGETFRFLISTGNQFTVLSAQGATRTANAGTLHIGGEAALAVEMENAIEGSDANFTYAGQVFDGLIAPNTLNQWDLLIDAPGGRMLFAPIGRPVTWAGYDLSGPVNLRIFHGVAISLQVDLGGTPTPAMLEIGSPIVFGNEAVGAQGGIVGDRAPALSIGGASWADLPAQVENLSVIQRFSPNGDPFVLVGSGIALDCPIALSYVHQELRTCVR